MKQALIVHGSGGKPDQIWFPWLADKLKKKDYDVISPQFPNTPEDQILENWLKTLGSYELSNDCTAIGHSLGVPFLLNVLERRPLKAVYLVAGFTGLLENQFDELVETFSNKLFDWKRIKKNCQQFYILHSDDDPYIAPEKTIDLAKNLEVSPILIQNAGHFNSAAGYYEFDFLYNLIQKQDI